DHLVALATKARGGEVRGGELRGVEEILARQGGIAIAVAGLHAGQGHFHVELRRGEVGRVVTDRGGPLAEMAVERFALEGVAEAERAGSRLHDVVGSRGDAGQGECEQRDGEAFHRRSPSGNGLRRRPNGSIRRSTLSLSNT